MTDDLVAYFQSLDRALNASEVAKLLGVRRDMIYAYAKCGEMPSINIGAKKTLLRFDPKQIAEWIRERQRHIARGPRS